MSLIIRPYKAGSVSGKALAEALGIKRMSQKNTKYKGGAMKAVLNWGCSEMPPLDPATLILNKPDKVKDATNKLEFFRKVRGRVRIPQFFTDLDDAHEFMRETGEVLVCRTLLRANSGRGIVIAEEEDELVEAQLYTTYIKKKFEYRIHVAFGQVIDVQQKARNLDLPDEAINWRIRNHDNGFIFKREGVVVSEHARQMAINCVEACGLDFGAVDIIYNERQDKYYVLEVNTAPGLEGQTLESYRKVFEKYV